MSKAPATALAGLAALLVTAGGCLAPRQQAGGVEYFPASAGLPFSEAVLAGDVLYLSGQIGVVPGTRTLAPGGIRGQARQALDNIGEILARHGLGFEDVFKCTVMLAHMGDWEAFNEVYVTVFDPGHLPARSAFGAAGLALGAAVEVECWAHLGRSETRCAVGRDEGSCSPA